MIKAHELLSKPENWIKGAFEGVKRPEHLPHNPWAYQVIHFFPALDMHKLASFIEPHSANPTNEIEIISGWNDDPLRTWTEVYFTLKRLDL